MLLPAFTVGCAERHYYRVDDPYYHDNHRWDPDEDRFYHQWEVETHREHREFRQRVPDEQKEYFTWRHGHDHDRDHDHDHDKH